ncbi:hypothetical protein C8R44DRAFT_985019 [Mycena epipterygia]|nr:hypothetical protein C8R44DRAFT_985019 [Mycena epipterygia]
MPARALTMAPFCGFPGHLPHRERRLAGTFRRHRKASGRYPVSALSRSLSVMSWRPCIARRRPFASSQVQWLCSRQTSSSLASPGSLLNPLCPSSLARGRVLGCSTFGPDLSSDWSSAFVFIP